MKCLRPLFLFLVLACPLLVRAQIGVSNLVDKSSSYNDRVTFFITNSPGYSYRALLNDQPIPVGTAVTVNKPDFYELFLWRTNDTTLAVATQYVRFIVRASERVGTEVGLPPHTPFPVINSASNEFAATHLRLTWPRALPAGYALPLVAWVVDENDNVVRANGVLAAADGSRFQLRRGVGSGFLVPSTTNGTATFQLNVSALSTNISIAVESNVAWTTVSGVLGASTAWPENSRIRVTGNLTVPTGGTLSIGAGSIVILNSRIDITNNGTINIDGAAANPVVFMPATNGQPWGGFVSKAANQGVIQAQHTIFTGAGAEPNWFGANGNPGSHRKEQALFYLDGGQQLTLTDCAAIYLPGQLGHSRSSSAITPIRLTRFLMQRCTTGGEFTGARLTVNASAFIECPDDTVNFVDGDNDALYIVDGTHFFTNTLFGWTKDDGIDSGGSGYGPLTYESCWFESTFHEGNSLSGYKNTYARNTVYFDCGQGIECGYDGPTGRLDHCFFSMNKSGVRHGDNYNTFSGYTGTMTVNDTISIFNHRDLFAFNWDDQGGWTNNYGQFFAVSNFLSRYDRFFPSNNVWNPAADGWRLADFGAAGVVGVGFGTRSESIAQLNGTGIPVGLSRFCTNEVSVDYEVRGNEGTLLSGTLVFPQGLTRQFIPASLSTGAVYRVALRNPVNAEITRPQIFFAPLLPSTNASVATTLVASNSVWRYHDKGVELGTAWRAPDYVDAGWSNGPAQLGFGDNDEATRISRTNSAGAVNPTVYFRGTFNVSNIESYTNLILRLLRDDGGVVYINGNEVYRSSSLAPAPATISFSTLANYNLSSAPADNTIDTVTLPRTVLTNGLNTIAVEIHQFDAGSSDLSFALWIVGNPIPAQPRIGFTQIGDDLVIRSTDGTVVIEEASQVIGPWTPIADSVPTGVSLGAPEKYYRLRK